MKPISAQLVYYVDKDCYVNVSNLQWGVCNYKLTKHLIELGLHGTIRCLCIGETNGVEKQAIE